MHEALGLSSSRLAKTNNRKQNISKIKPLFGSCECCFLGVPLLPTCAWWSWHGLGGGPLQYLVPGLGVSVIYATYHGTNV